MIQLRLLACSFAATAAVLPATAQKPAATPSRLPLTATFAAPSLFAPGPAPSPEAFTLRPTGPAHVVTTGKPFLVSKPQVPYLLLKKDSREIAQAAEPCLKLRVYNFTRRDLQVAHPHASSELDCTPAANGRLLQGPATSAPAGPSLTAAPPSPVIPR